MHEGATPQRQSGEAKADSPPATMMQAPKVPPPVIAKATTASRLDNSDAAAHAGGASSTGSGALTTQQWEQLMREARRAKAELRESEAECAKLEEEFDAATDAAGPAQEEPDIELLQLAKRMRVSAGEVKKASHKYDTLEQQVVEGYYQWVLEVRARQAANMA